MKIIGCDFHPSYQQIAMTDTETGEVTERRLIHARGEAEKFYGGLEGAVMVGIESTGSTQWFEALLSRLGHGYRIGDAKRIRAAETRAQKHDRRDAELMMTLLLQDRFPAIWVPSVEQRDTRQLLQHRHKIVGMRRSVKNQLQHLALNQGLQRKSKLWSKAGQEELTALPLLPWADLRRRELQRMLQELDRQIAPLDGAVQQAAAASPEAALLMTHPGVGPVTALATVLILGPVSRFARGKQVGSYLGMIPKEHSSGDRRQRLGSISKQGSTLLRSLLVEAAQSAIRCDTELGRQYRRMAHRKHRSVAKVAIARKLAVRLYWMLRTGKNYAQCFGSHAG